MRDTLTILRRALPLLVSALVIAVSPAEEGPEAEPQGSPDVNALLTQGRYEEALPFLAAMEQETRQAARNNDTPENRKKWAQTLLARGFVEWRLQQFDEALAHLRKARDLTVEGQFGPEFLASILDELGRAEGKTGFYDQAEQSLLQAIEEHRKLKPVAREPWLSVSQNHLGLLYLTTGRYEEAGQIFHQTLGQAGEDSQVLSFQHECLGKYFFAMRSYAKAAEHHEEARKRALSTGKRKEDPTVISLTGQIGLALLRLGPGSHDDARRYLQEAATLTRELWELRPSRVNTLSLGSHLSNLGQLALEEGDNEKARDIAEESLALYRKLFGEDSLYLPPYYNNLGFANRQLGNYEKALRSYRRSMDLYRSTVGARHQGYIEVTNDYLETLFLSGTSPGETTTQTIKFTTQALELFDDIIAFGTERDRLNWLRENQLLNLPCSLGNDPSFIANTILRTKARIIDSLLSEQQDSARDPELARLRDSYKQKQRELDDLRFRYEDEDKVSAVAGELTALEARLRSAQAGTAVTSVTATWQKVQETLPPHSAFIDYVRYTDLRKPGPDNLSYGALLVLPEGEPRWIPLGTDRDLTIWLGVLKDRLRYRSHLLSTEKTAAPPALRMSAALHRLYDLFWAPVAAHLPEETDTVGVSPDAGLNFISFAVLLDEEEQFLSEKYRQLVYYASARDLLVEQERPSLRSGPWSLIAVPEFEAHEGASDEEKETTDVLSRVVMETIEGLADIPGVRRELKLLKKIIPRHSQATLSLNSSEQDVRGLSDSPVVLHLANHAFLLPPAEETASAELQDFNQAPDHFYRSGLVLTEAKKAHAARARGEAVPFDRDGVLFSDEVKNLPLQNTRLVTLSSCDSGMGESVRGDGVLGLRRGFTLAGSTAILLSLWPVSDDSTPAFMKHMYQLSLSTDRIGQSLWETQRRNLSEVDPSDDAAMEEAVLRYGCFVLCQRGPLQAAVEMPEIREPSRARWAIALAIAAVLVFFATRKWRRKQTA
ncbi:MAG: CHAT domain-containing protein [Roseibacillus sp.]|nr:CHAT domain-containing protein [Roseibacillus sp.]